MSTNVKLQYSASSRTYTMTVPAAIVKAKGWNGTYKAPEELRAKKPDLPPDTEGTVLCIEDDPDTGGFRVFADGQDKRKKRAAPRRKDAAEPAAAQPPAEPSSAT